MKEDAPTPDKVPKKKRQLEAALDLWLAVWLSRGDLTPSERRRVEQEKHRRKTSRPRVSVGFTGTRAGMTPRQKETVVALIEELQPDEAHHGDCVGADATFHEVCAERGIEIVLHPPENNKARAFCQADRTEKVRPYLDRNKDIVVASTVMLSTPKESREPTPGRGQGTWSTVRYARKRDKPIKVVMPDGTTS